MTLPWTHVLASGIGSLPGTDPLEAARFVVGELPDLPFLPELPGRGAAGDLAGRGTAFLSGLYVDVQPSGWRITPRPSRDGQRARDLLSYDLEAIEQACEGHAPPLLKISATGPWTLASLLELHRGAKVLSDHGAVADLAESLAEGLRDHLADLQRRLPDTVLVLQLDEPSLPAVQAARIRTASGFATYRTPQPQVVRDRLATVLAAAEHTVVHCCAADAPVALLVDAGAGSLSLDASLSAASGDDALGQALEEGHGLLLGCVPSTDADLPSVRDLVDLVGRLRDRVGLQTPSLVLTPTCGLAGASPAHARAALRRCVEAGQALEEEP